MTIRSLFYLGLIALVLSACSPGQNTQNNTAQQNPGTAAAQLEADRAAARENLERMLASKRQRQSEQDEQQRLAEEKAQAAAAEAAKPHYDPTRLKIAFKYRQWADITVPDLNIHAWLKSNWKDGVMHMRFALLGDKTALRLFTGNWKYFRLVFADQGGNNLHQAILSTRDLHWDEAGLRNSGVPTMEFEGDSEVSLEVYESIVQWNLKWENDVE
jgi:hypothetical protein